MVARQSKGGTQQPGHAGVTRDDLEHAAGKVEASALRAVATSIPSTTWDDIGGQEEVKYRLQQVRCCVGWNH